MHIDGRRQRRGGSGRIPDAAMENYEVYARMNITLPPDVNERLEKFCHQEERARSWVIAKAVDFYLKSKGY